MDKEQTARERLVKLGTHNSEEYDKLNEMAFTRFRMSRLGAKGQAVTPSDNLEYWYVMECRDLGLAAVQDQDTRIAAQDAEIARLKKRISGLEETSKLLSAFGAISRGDDNDIYCRNPNPRSRLHIKIGDIRKARQSLENER